MKKLFITALVCSLLTGCGTSGGSSLTSSSVKDDPENPLLVRNKEDFSAVRVSNFKNLEVVKTKDESKYTTVRASFTITNTGKRTLNFLTYFTGKAKMTDAYGEEITSKYRYILDPIQDETTLRVSPVLKCFGSLNPSVYISYLKPGEKRNYQLFLSPHGGTKKSEADAATAEIDGMKKIKGITGFSLGLTTNLRGSVSNEEDYTDAEIVKKVKKEFRAYSDVSHKISYSGSFKNGKLVGSVTNRTGEYLSNARLLFSLHATDEYGESTLKKVVYVDIQNLKPGATKAFNSDSVYVFSGELNAPGAYENGTDRRYGFEDGTITPGVYDENSGTTYDIESLTPLNNAAYMVDQNKK